MHSRAVDVAVGLVLTVVLAAGAAGAVAAEQDRSLEDPTDALAEHEAPVGEAEIVEIQVVSDENTPPGEVTVTYSYHVGSEIAGLEITLPEPVEQTALDGFESTANPRTYRWDGTTAEPTIRTRYAVNRTGADGLEAVATSEWAMIASPNERSTGIGYRVQRGTNVTVDRETVVDGDGVAGDTMVYLGSYERITASDGSFEIVVSDAADIEDRAATLAAVEQALDRSAATLDAGVEEPVMLFVVGEPLRRGGLAIGSDFWVSERTLPPELTVWHEFVHTQQRYDPTATSQWTIEGSADYYSAVLALTQGAIQYREFQDRLSAGNEYEGVVLADPDTWAGTRANYEQGALVLAALDRELRANSDGSYEDVLRAANAREREVSAAALEALTADIAGTDLAQFFETSVRSPPPQIEVPPPTIYEASNDGASLDLGAADVTVGEDEVAEVRVTLSNEGEETSLAPTLAATASGPASASLGGANGTRSGDRLVFDHLPPGASVQTTVLVDHAGENASVALAVEDVSGVSAEAGAAVTVAEDRVENDATASEDGGEPENEGSEGADTATDIAGDEESASTDDGTGSGFGVTVAAAAVLGLELLARRRR